MAMEGGEGCVHQSFGGPTGYPPEQLRLTSSVDFSTAEINRNLDLLTEKVTKLAIEGGFQPSIW